MERAVCTAQVLIEELLELKADWFSGNGTSSSWPEDDSKDRLERSKLHAELDEMLNQLRGGAGTVPKEEGAKRKGDANGPLEAQAMDLYHRVAYCMSNSASGMSALCLSGGGIRSAAFGLGILQGMSRHQLLAKFDYLSTVSGGGYIGGWLTAWARREINSEPISGQGGKQVFKDRVQARLGQHSITEPPPLAALRRTQNFLTPRVGLGSPDSWTGAATVLRNLVLTWWVFIPLLASVLLVPRIAESGLLVYAFSFALDEQITAMNMPCTPESGLIKIIGYLVENVTQARPMAEQAECLVGAAPALFRPYTFAELPGTVAVVLGMAYFIAHRPSQRVGERLSRMDNRDFVLFSLVPICVGACFLLLSVSALHSTWAHPTKDQLRNWIGCCTVFFLVAGFLSRCTFVRNWPACTRALFRGLAFRSKSPSHFKDLPVPNTRGWISRPFIRDVIALGAAGSLSGLMIWVGLWLRPVLSTLKIYDLRDLAVFGVPWLFLSFILGLSLFAAVTSMDILDDPEHSKSEHRKSAERDREWLGRAAGWCGAIPIAWIFLSFPVLYGWEIVSQGWRWLTGVTVLSGFASIVGGASPLTRAKAGAGAARSLLANRLVPLLSVVFLACLAVLIAHGTAVLLRWMGFDNLELQAACHPSLAGCSPAPISSELLEEGRHARSDQRQLFTAIAAAAVLFSMYWFAAWVVNVNYFSLNDLYRNRLVRTFLGASNLTSGASDEDNVRDKFTGFSEADNMKLADLWVKGRRDFPYPVVNMTLNLTSISARHLAWQERKGEPFVATPLFTGGHNVGYRPTDRYAGGLTLGTAMSISGAAVSPNWGFHSSPLTAFLMTLFNARLGVWLGNPRGEGNPMNAWSSEQPKMGWSLFRYEAFGRTDDQAPYVYLSDGGHFENLGIYEMLRRRCKSIVVSDAGADFDVQLADLGNALRKASIDLGVTVIFERIQVAKRGSDPANPGVYCAVGKVVYPEPHGFTGEILYIKPGLYDDAPADVRAYAAANSRFPHDTTLNQWFTESQFESYRALGSHAVRMITAKRKDLEANAEVQDYESLEVYEFLEKAREYINAFRQPLPR